MSEKKTPLLSIIMPVYNAGDFLLEAVRSIQNQTYQNWELIAIDDASEDNSFPLLKKLEENDSRIKVFRNKRNLGVSKAANLAISRTKGDYIARMDADDICFPQRIEKQLSYLVKNPQTVALGTQCQLINKDGEVIGKKSFPLKFKGVKEEIFIRIPVQQPTLMVNKKRLPKDFIWYDENAETGEEVELLFRLFQIGKVENLSKVLLKYRIHGNNTSLKDPKKTFLFTFKTRASAIFKYNYRPTFLGLTISLVQFLIIGMLPSKLIYPLYALIRGFSRSKESQRVSFSKEFAYQD